MTIGFIPVKTASTRAPGKNFELNENGETLLHASVKYLLQFDWIDRILVSTNDIDGLLSLDKKSVMSWPRSKVSIEQRPHEWSSPDMPLVELYGLALETFPDVHYVVATQVDNPFKPFPKNAARLYHDFINSDRDELFTVDTRGRKTGALHFMKESAIRHQKLAHYCGVYVQELWIDIDTEQDLDNYRRMRDQMGTI